MNDLFISENEIEIELQEMEQISIRLAEELRIVAQYVKYIFIKIKEASDIESAEYYFNILEKIQSCLAKIVYREELDIPDKLHRFMSDFDNFESIKHYYFEKIKKGKYSF